MDQSTYAVTQKYENEANLFALELLYSDENLQPYLSRGYDRAAEYMGVPYDLAARRMREVSPKNPAEEWI